MECSSALDALRAKLESSFGKGVAMMILASSANAADVSTIAITPDGFSRLADAVCSDQRVIDMWGAAAVADQRVQWKTMVS